MDGRVQNSKWVNAVEKNGVVVQVWPIEIARLPTWIRERLSRHKLIADASAASLLAERVEGNLLAAHQEVESPADMVQRDAPDYSRSFGKGARRDTG